MFEGNGRKRRMRNRDTVHNRYYASDQKSATFRDEVLFPGNKLADLNSIPDFPCSAKLRTFP
jgi:hypothetical protein